MKKEILTIADLIELVGKERYVELLKKYNLCTKKMTYGRAKGFYKEITKIIKKETKKIQLELEEN